MLPNNNHSKGLSKKNSRAGTKILISSQGFLCFKGREKKCITELLISSAQACLHGSAHNKTCELGLDRQSKLTILKFTLQDVYVLNKKYIIVPEHVLEQYNNNAYNANIFFFCQKLQINPVDDSNNQKNANIIFKLLSI